MNQRESFALANRAFELMTMAEREIVLTIFADLRYPSIIDRFEDAVYQVVARVTPGSRPAPPETKERS